MMLYLDRPDLKIFFDNKNDFYSYTSFSNVKVPLHCPICGLKKVVSVNSLNRNGFSCSVCSDGFSIPNKFMAILLKTLNENFASERRFEWSQNKQYDFYLPEKNLIIEMHGAQHYEERSCFGDATLQEVQANDKLKENLAKINNIENYIIVDSRHSKLEFLKENVKKQLGDFLELKDINWQQMWEKINSSLVHEVWRLHDQGLAGKEIARRLDIAASTVSNYNRRRS